MEEEEASTVSFPQFFLAVFERNVAGPALRTWEGDGGGRRRQNTKTEHRLGKWNKSKDASPLFSCVEASSFNKGLIYKH